MHGNNEQTRGGSHEEKSVQGSGVEVLLGCYEKARVDGI